MKSNKLVIIAAFLAVATVLLTFSGIFLSMLYKDTVDDETKLDDGWSTIDPGGSNDQTIVRGNSGKHILTDLDELMLEDKEAHYVCRVGDGKSEDTTTYYQTVAAAAAVVESEGSITLIQDCIDGDGDGVLGADEWGLSGSNATYGVIPTAAFTLEGNGFEISGLNHYAFFNDEGFDLHVKNATITAVRVIRTTATGTTEPTNISFENCTLSSFGNHTIYLRGNVAADIYHTFNLKNCIAHCMPTATEADSAVIFTLGDHSSPWHITVDDSTLINEQNNSNSSNNSAVVKLRGYTSKLDLTGDTLIDMRSNSICNDGIYCYEYINKAEINIDSSVVFNAAIPTGRSLVSSYVRCDAGNDALAINDQGATYRANANAAIHGVVIPFWLPVSEGVEYSYTINDAEVELGSMYRGNAAFELELKRVVIEPVDPETDAGSDSDTVVDSDTVTDSDTVIDSDTESDAETSESEETQGYMVTLVLGDEGASGRDIFVSATEPTSIDDYDASYSGLGGNTEITLYDVTILYFWTTNGDFIDLTSDSQVISSWDDWSSASYDLQRYIDITEDCMIYAYASV